MARGSSSIGIGAGGATDEERFDYWVYVEDVDAAPERRGPSTQNSLPSGSARTTHD